MFLHTTYIEAKPGYRLFVRFNNGETGEIDLSAELWGEMFSPLKDEKLFATARQDEIMRTVVWANGADLAPEFLFELMTKQKKKAA
jgi:hypothetical protein